MHALSVSRYIYVERTIQFRLSEQLLCVLVVALKAYQYRNKDYPIGLWMR